MGKDDKELKLTIPQGCHGHDLQELMYKFVNWFALANEKRDTYADAVAQQKLFVEATEAQALLAVEDDIRAEGLSRVNIDSKKARALTKEIPMVEIFIQIWPTCRDSVKDKTTTPLEQRNILLTEQSKLSSMESKAKQLERLISVCQSGLSFDRQEAGMPQR